MSDVAIWLFGGAMISLVLAIWTPISGTLSGAMMLLFALVLWNDYADMPLSAMFVLLAVIIWHVTLTKSRKVGASE